ncbi:hypothetical protein RND81_09G183700 [Saponaria officinalis]|uniref:Uncharacterized protein n=1 Tax=Saponaria officinalis TaxID=3572 RepID=A0AAW1IPB5_SAPOF
MVTFYESLLPSVQWWVNISSGGSFYDLSAEKARNVIENMVSVEPNGKFKWGTLEGKPRPIVEPNVNSLLDDMCEMVEYLLLEKDRDNQSKSLINDDDDYDLVEHSEDALNVDVSPPLNHDMHESSLNLHGNDDMFNDDCNFVKPCELVNDVLMPPLDDMIVLDDSFSLKHDVSDLSTPLCELGNMLNELENDEFMQFENNETLESKQFFENDKFGQNENCLEGNEIFNDNCDENDEIFDDRLEVKWDDENDDPLNESRECKIDVLSGFEMCNPLVLQFEQNDKSRGEFEMLNVYVYSHKLLISILSSLVFYLMVVLNVTSQVYEDRRTS